MKEEQKLSGLLAELAALGRTKSAPARLEAQLMAEFRRGREAPRRRVAHPFRWWAAAAALAAAAAVTVLVIQTRTREALPHGRASVSGVTPQPRRDREEALPQRPVQAEVRPPHKRKAVKRPRPQAPAPAEVATQIFPVSPAPLAEGEFYMVVRVSVPRSTMARFGLPVLPDRVPERVKADLWLGDDGIIRAVRFVN